MIECSTEVNVVQITNNQNNITEVEHSTSFLKKWFNEFNRKYFNNKLDDIELKWVNDSKEKFGGFYYKPRTAKLEEYVEPLYIELSSSVINTFDTFRNVLVHEMVHYYVDCYLNTYTEEQWNKARELGDKEASRVLGLLPPNNHLGNWLHVASELNSKFKELNLTAFEPIDKVRSNFKDLHIVMVAKFTDFGRKRQERYKVYSTKSLAELKKKIEDCKTVDINKPIYKFFELKILDYKKLATSGVQENIVGDWLTPDIFNYLVKSRTISNVYDTYLGEMNGFKDFKA